MGKGRGGEGRGGAFVPGYINDNFSEGYMCVSVLERVEIIHKSKFLPGTVEKNSSTIRSSGRNRTYACAMPVHCSDH